MENISILSGNSVVCMYTADQAHQMKLHIINWKQMTRSPTRKSYASFPLLFLQNYSQLTNNDYNLYKHKFKPENRIEREGEVFSFFSSFIENYRIINLVIQYILLIQYTMFQDFIY